MAPATLLDSMAPALSDEISRPVTIAEARRAPTKGGVPAEGGIYSWWAASNEALPLLTHVPHPSNPELNLLYIGIAPARITSNANLRTRIISRDLGGNLGSSRFRRTLAALLWEAEGWHPSLASEEQVTFRPPDNSSLTRWQESNLRVGWHVLGRAWENEREVIAEMGPSLNLAESESHPLHDVLAAARARLIGAARANQTTPN